MPARVRVHACVHVFMYSCVSSKHFRCTENPRLTLQRAQMCTMSCCSPSTTGELSLHVPECAHAHACSAAPEAILMCAHACACAGTKVGHAKVGHAKVGHAKVGHACMRACAGTKVGPWIPRTWLRTSGSWCACACGGARRWRSWASWHRLCRITSTQCGACMRACKERVCKDACMCMYRHLQMCWSGLGWVVHVAKRARPNVHPQT